jgi:hypothetical protein
MNNLFQIDYNVIIDDIIKIFVPIILSGIVYLLSQVIGKKRFEKVSQALESKSKLAQLAVSFAEQAFSSLDGVGKYAKAEEWLFNAAKSHGIKMSDADLKTLIEAEVLKLKKEVIKDVPQVIKQADTPISPAQPVAPEQPVK